MPSCSIDPIDIAIENVSSVPRVIGANVEQQPATTTSAVHRKSLLFQACFSTFLVFTFFEILLRIAHMGPLEIPNPRHFAPVSGACSSVFSYRQYAEGFALVHYCSEGARLTAKRFVEGAPYGIILGDSFVEAAQVSDDAIVSSQLQEIASNQRVPINVRQYGWSGSGPPVYVAISQQINQVFHPAWVTVVLNWDDLGTYGLSESSYWRGRINDDLSLLITEAPESDTLVARPLSSAFRALRTARKKSFLVYLCTEKLRNALQAAPDIHVVPGIQDRRANRAMVHALKTAYGDRLLVVYIPQIQIDRAEDVAAENDLSSACREQAVRCVSLREEMLRERDQVNQLLAGFSNTVPGEGHLNSRGHAVLARVIWQTLHSNPR